MYNLVVEASENEYQIMKEIKNKEINTLRNLKMNILLEFEFNFEDIRSRCFNYYSE